MKQKTGYLMKHCTATDAQCPRLVMDSFVFEMVKQYAENRLQLVISPLILYADGAPPPSHHTHESFGKYTLRYVSIAFLR